MKHKWGFPSQNNDYINICHIKRFYKNNLYKFYTKILFKKSLK